MGSGRKRVNESNWITFRLKDPKLPAQGNISYFQDESTHLMYLGFIQLEYPLGTKTVKCARDVVVGKNPCCFFNISNNNGGWG